MNDKIKILSSALLAASTALLLAASGLSFTDDGAIRHPEAVSALAELGILSGKPDGRFDPDGATLRGEMAKMLSLLADSDAARAAPSGFTDISGTWAEPYIDHCYALGLVSGRGDGTFDPNATVTGTEAAKMLLALSGYDQGEFSGPGWADSVNGTAEAAGLYTGFTADPSAPLTRDGAALLIYNKLNLLSEDSRSTGGEPTDVAVLPDGSLLVTDGYTRTVFQLRGLRMSLFAGAVTEAADVNGRPLGGYYDASAQRSTFKLPWAVEPFLEGWAVSDAENNVVRLVKDGQVQTINPRVADGSSRTLSYPTGLAAADDGSLYVSDTHNGLIRCIRPDGTMTTAAKGLDGPMGLCWHDGALYIAETGANRILRLQDGKTAVAAGSGEDGYADGTAQNAAFSGPKALTAAPDGTLYVSDTGNSAIRVIRDGKVETLLIRDPADPESNYPVSPAGLALKDGHLYVCDSFTGMLLMLAV